MNTRKLAFFIIMTALCLAIQIAPRPPNTAEFTSFFAFIVGLTEGAVIGAFLGSFVMLINGFVSPYGFGGLNIPFQMAGMIIAGVLGGAYRRFTPNINFSAKFSLETAVLGALIALVFDLITNIGFGIQLVFFTRESLSLALFTTFAIGAFYSLLHIISNCVVFGVLFLPIMNALNSSKVGGSNWSKKEHLYS
jgi:hypothetical protein